MQLWKDFAALSIIPWQLQWVHTSAMLMSSGTHSSIITAVGGSFQVSRGWMGYKWSLPKVHRSGLINFDTGFLMTHSVFYPSASVRSQHSLTKMKNNTSYLIIQIFKNAKIALVWQIRAWKKFLLEQFCFCFWLEEHNSNLNTCFKL